MNKLGFIGLGSMGRAILRGIENSPGLKDVLVYCYDPLFDKSSFKSEIEVVRNCSYVVLAVKPQSADEVLDKIKTALTSRHVVISICAGISIEHIRSRTREDLKVVQVMPNIPVMLGLGASAVAFSDNLSSDEQQFARSIMDSCGITRIIPSDKMNEIICVNGSSPAFIYLFAKCFTDYAKEQGIDENDAMNLFAQTLIGAAKMLCESGLSPDELIAQVSSPAGTTIAGLEQLRTGGFIETVKAACVNCTKRAYELGNILYKKKYCIMI
jgi:pyrroline-5-carboxylate reductase